MSLRFSVTVLVFSLLAACATPPQACSPEWVEWKTGSILTDFADDNRRDVRRLRTFATQLDGGDIGPLTALRLPAMIEDFKTLARSFEEAALPELNATMGQCDSQQELVPAFSSFLRDEGVGEDVLEWVEFLAAFAVDGT